MNSMKGKIISICLTISTISILLISGIGYFSSRDNITKETLSKIQFQSDNYAVKFDGWLNTQGKILDEMGTDMEYRKTYDKAILTTLFNQKYDNNKGFSAVYFGLKDNTVFYNSSTNIPKGYTCTEREWYKKAIAEDKLVFLSPYIDAFTDKMVITISKPVKVDGKTIGAVAVDIFVDYLVELTEKASVCENSYAFFIDDKKNFVVHPNKEFQPSKDNSISFDKVLDGRFNFITKGFNNDNTIDTVIDYDNIDKYFITSKVNTTNWRFGFAVPKSYVMEPIQSLLNKFIIAIVACTIIMIVLLFIIITKAFKPFEEIVSNLDRFAKGDFTNKKLEINSKRKDEIGKINKSLYMAQEELKSMVEEIIENSQSISASSEELAATVEELSSKAENINEAVNTIAGGIQDSSAATEEISKWIQA